ncbi:PREDICTED: uncharacterized protein LOC108752968 [Trachymyrmex septentrionalis]|uniref:uncharacterized protein LOC108752968 n=1 Tax=Trachymyrmex septentrionalis TaxID=34720 RepID=UPI00084F2271|nr:PREDICTED: uncharacterized protein LOC108752968 [Trachymyrmex septentrionalis]
MLFYLLIAASPFLINAIQQNLDNAVEIIQLDSNSPMAYKQSNREKRDDSPPPTCNSNVSFDKCMLKCFIILVYDPVCGTDNITYMNRSQLKCAQCCGKNVTVKCSGNCTNCN